MRIAFASGFEVSGLKFQIEGRATCRQSASTHANPVLYESVGFKKCTAIELPDALASRRITNPDAPQNEHYIELTSAGRPVAVVPVLFSSQVKYEVNSGKDFFAYLTFKLLAVERVEDRWRPRMVDGSPWLLEVSEVGNFHEQIGRNTDYIIHPEELLADNFVYLINKKGNLPTPQIVESMRQILADRQSP